MCKGVQLYIVQHLWNFDGPISQTVGLLEWSGVARQTWHLLEASFFPVPKNVFAIAVQLLPSHIVLYIFTAAALRQNMSLPTVKKYPANLKSVASASLPHTDGDHLFLWQM
jgi:hypothetical protein